jgi:hypothetical protein
MNMYSHVRAAVRTAVCLAALLAPAAAPAADAKGVEAQAQLLDRAEFPCANCFFGVSDHYYCFATENKILIGHYRTPVMNWRDDSRNALTKVHGGWAGWTAPGQTVALRYDDAHIWLPRPQEEPKSGFWAGFKGAIAWIARAKSKQVSLTRSSPRDIFTGNAQCRGTGAAKTPGL